MYLWGTGVLKYTHIVLNRTLSSSQTEHTHTHTVFTITLWQNSVWQWASKYRRNSKGNNEGVEDWSELHVIYQRSARSNFSCTVWPSAHTIPVVLCSLLMGRRMPNFPLLLDPLCLSAFREGNITAYWRALKKALCAFFGGDIQWDAPSRLLSSLSTLFCLGLVGLLPTYSLWTSTSRCLAVWGSGSYHCERSALYRGVQWDGCYSSLWRTGGSSLWDRAVRTLLNFS